MPKPKKGESQKDFVSRCIPIVIDEGTAEDNKQAAAICYSMYRRKDKKGTKEMLNCKVRGLEFKEIDGDLHVLGLIATTHTDEINDKLIKMTLDKWAGLINDGYAVANKASYHHDRSDPKVVGRGVEGSAKVLQLPDGEYGLYVDTHVNKTWEGYEDLTYELDEKFIDGFSIEYNTYDGKTTHTEYDGDQAIRILGPDTELHGWGFASRPVNPNAAILNFDFKEVIKNIKEGSSMKQKTIEKKEGEEEKPDAEGEKKPEAEKKEKKEKKEGEEEKPEPEKKPVEESKEFKEFLAHKAEFNKEKKEKEFKEKVAGVVKNLEVKEKVLKGKAQQVEGKEVPVEFKEFKEIFEGKKVINLKEQMRRASVVAESNGLWEKGTSAVERREYKNFQVSGNERHLEFKSLGLTTNQNTDTDYLQSTAELQDVYDPIIYNALNQITVAWNVFRKEDYSSKGNNQVQFVLKTAANTTAAFYNGNSVTTGNVTRLKYQTKFKKVQVGVSVDGDMIAAARGGPVSDVFAKEVEDSTMDMLAVVNAALFAEVGLETAAGPIGLEYITDSAGNTTLYNLTRSSTNKLAPTSAGDTYINQSSTTISMTNLRKAITQAVTEGSMRRNLVFFTSPTQGDMYRGKWDDTMRHQPKDTIFGFSTDVFVDGVPVFEDKDINTDDWFLVDLDSHKIAVWVPPTIEKLGKTADSEEAFIKMYFAAYNTRPRAMVQIYGCATS